MHDPAFKSATREAWKRIRPHEDVALLDQIFAAQPLLAIIVQVAFEGGRQWQAEHPTASVEFPDYDAPKTP